MVYKGPEAMRKWRAENPERQKEQGRKDANKHRAKYPELVKARQKAYRSSPEGRAVINAIDAKRRARNRDYVRVAKQNPCAHCGGTFHPAAMEFHHLDPTQKLNNIATMVGTGRSMKSLQEEIAKCVLICANCHRIQTFKESDHD